MTLSDFNKRISDFTLNFLVEREKHAFIVANDAIALVTRRVQGKGVKSTAEAFKIPYSQQDLSKYLPPAFVKSARKGKITPSYENYRKSLGLPINFRNLSLTGKMWASIVTDKESESLQKITMLIHSQDQQKLVNINSDREETNILSLAEIEIDHLQELTKTWLNNELRAIQ